MKHRYPCFIAEWNLGTSSGAYELKHEYASTSALITRTQMSSDILFCDKTRVSMFYFDSNTARPIVLYYSAAVLFESLYWQGVVWFSGR